MIRPIEFFTLFICLFCLISCTQPPDLTIPLPAAETIILTVPSETPSPTLSPAATIRPTEISTSTPVPTPSLTPIPYTTIQLFPTVTPIGVFPVKEVFMQFGSTGGDGGQNSDYYFGRAAPDLVIYMDGQVIKQERQDRISSFVIGELSSDELCSLLGELENTGYFEWITEIYEFDETTQFSDGAGETYIFINGPKNKAQYIYGPYIEYLVDEIAAAYELVSTYSPPSEFAPYLPDHLALWIEPLVDESLEDLPDWPADLPPISEIHADPSSNHVAVDSELIAPLMELFDSQLKQLTFKDGDIGYDVILRPILPHETPRNFPSFPYQSIAFNLPFQCEGLDLPVIESLPTRTPTPSTPISTLSPQAVKLQGRIVFDSDRDGNHEIYVMYADGTQVIRLTNYSGYDGQPTWSPDGQKIAFVSDRSGRDEVYTMNADGTDVKRLTFSSSDKFSPAWSFDGTRIAYVNSHLADSPDYDSEVYVIDLKSNESIHLTDNEPNILDVLPVWLNENQIMYVSGERPEFQLSVVNENGSDHILLREEGSYPDISPDQQKLAYTVGVNIYIVSLSDLFLGEYESRKITEEIKFYSSPTWAPDGQMLVYVADRDEDSEIYVMGVDGAEPIRLTFNRATDSNPDWTP